MVRLVRSALAAGLLFVLGCDGPMGPPGPAGPQGPAGDDGNDGADGTDGADGADGADGQNSTVDGGRPDGGASPGDAGALDGGKPALRADCKWCAPSPGVRLCAPDQKTLQRCVDDGDGCGHWEAVQTCSGKCSFQYGAEKDALGNPSIAGWGCVDTSTPDCRTNITCSAQQSCNAVTGQCETSANWATPTATIRTAFDGLTHSFTARSPSVSASCTGGTVQDYWNIGSSRTCGVTIIASAWSSSSAGASYAGTPIKSAYLSANVTGSGTTTAGYCSVTLDATRFAPGSTESCTLSVTSANLQPGGSIEGTITYQRSLTGHNEPSAASSIQITARFKTTIAAEI